MPKCDTCGKHIELSCAEERAHHYMCVECGIKYEAKCRYMHDPMVKKLVDALRLCAPSASGAEHAAAVKALEVFGGIHA